MPKVKMPDEKKRYEEWKNLCESYKKEYVPFFQSILVNGKLDIDSLKSPDLFSQIKKGVAEAYNLIMEAKKRFDKSKNKKITEGYKNFISEMNTILPGLNELYILMVKKNLKT